MAIAVVNLCFIKIDNGMMPITVVAFSTHTTPGLFACLPAQSVNDLALDAGADAVLVGHVGRFLGGVVVVGFVGVEVQAGDGIGYPGHRVSSNKDICGSFKRSCS